MPQNIKEERYKWIKPILDKEITIVNLIKICPHSESSIKRWLRDFRKGGIDALEPKSTKPKTQPNETPIWIKERVIEIRKDKKVCAKKLHWKLKKQNLIVPISTIGKILKEEGLVRKYRVRKIKYKYIKVERKPGELVEIDVKYVPGAIGNRRYYQYTAIDTASRWRYLAIYDEQTTYHSIIFLKDVISHFPHKINAIKTDNGSVFTNYYLGTNKRSDVSIKTIHALDMFCRENNIVHYLIDPGKPAQNGTVERSHRSDQESFYDRSEFKNIKDLEVKIKIWNEEYNNLEHCGLNGKTPIEMLHLFQQEKVSKEVS
jgi:transposase InsO family protein